MRLFTLLLLALAGGAFAQEFHAGVGSADITPSEPIRLAGYASRDHPHERVDQPLHVKALALQDGAGALTLIVTADTIGTPRSFNDALAARVENELKIPREHFLFACSHSHSTPVIAGGLEDMYALSPEQAQAVQRYTAYFQQQAFAAAEAAVHSLRPASLTFGKGEARFAANRRQFTVKGVIMGFDPDGLTDRQVPVLRVQGSDGAPIAVLFGYACHNTTPGATYEVSGDWAGYAQAELERNYPGLTALFITGCGADANPYPRGSMQLARAHGVALAGAVAQVLTAPMQPVAGPIRAAFARADLPLEKPPGPEYYEAKLQEKAPATQRYARHFLDRLARGEALATSYPAPLQVLRFGNSLTLLGISGETCVDYAYRLRRELPGEQVWPAGYCNDVFAYVPSMRVLLEGGYEADASIIYYGLPTRFAAPVEDTLVGKLRELVQQTGGPAVPAKPAK